MPRRAPHLALGVLLAGAALVAQGEPQGDARMQAMQSVAQKLAQTPDDVALQRRLSSLATGIDVQQIEAPTEERFDLQQEAGHLLEPVVRIMSSWTEKLREEQEVKRRLDILEGRLKEAELVGRGLGRARTEAADPILQTQLDREVARWNSFLTGLRDERLVLNARMSTLGGDKPMAEAIREAVGGFFEKRGQSLLLAILACFLTVVSLRAVHRTAVRFAGAGRRARVSLRLLDVVLQLMVGVGAIVAVLIVFYVREDFELLSLALVFLIGVGWALSRTLPQFLAQLRLLLNIGPVREGERLILDGLPYRVDALRVHSRLVNPELQGGVLRVPVGELLTCRSRRSHPDEPWFPTRQGDWVVLGDGTWGRVEVQTPEQVVLLAEQLRRTLRTADFLAGNPGNLSAGFLIKSAFGIDYGLQRISTTVVPERMAQALRDGLARLVDPANLVRVTVEFAAAGASSLDLEARVQFAGAAAPQYGVLRRAVQRLLVDACTQNGWNIPFPQLTVHRGDAGAAGA